ncbi:MULTISPECIES: ABC transporter permease [unclassified Kribbella]|uniref:ABC transporter permease n=1 Tax=unclassified Kribbella TaxID=2644121 RepID=UPI00301A559D
MTTTLLVRRFLIDYVRNPVNLVVLVLVPVVFVVVAAGSMADAAKLLGGGSGPAVQTATAGWAAGFLAAVAMYFQTRAARAADRRLVLAGLPATRLVAARIGTGLILAAFVGAAALLALAARTGIDQLGRTVAGTLMFGVVYLAIGALVGAVVRNPVNGTVLILFVWIMDVFFGPAVGSPDRLATRWFPTHFVTLWMVDLPSRHGGRLGDLGWALAWTVGALAVAWVVVIATTRVAHRSVERIRVGSRADQFLGGLRMGLRDYRRNPVLWALLVVVPVVFIWLSKVITEDGYMTLSLVDDGTKTDVTFWLPDMHAGTMTPMAISALATLAGLFVVLDARAGDRRLGLAGFRTGALLGARLAVIGVAVLLVTAASLAVTALVFDARQWPVYAAGNLLLAATYALIGVCLGPIFGRVSGVFIAFLLPFLDIGIAQSPMLRAEPPGWARALPGYGADRVLLDGGLTATFDQTGPLLLAFAWLAVLGAATALVFRPVHGRTEMRRRQVHDPTVTVDR